MIKKRIVVFDLLIALLIFSNGLAVAAGPSCSCEESRDLSLQSPHLEGHDVWELQQNLKELGLYEEEPNSVYDWQTHLAVKEFQKNYQLEVTGVVDQETWLDLGKVLNKRDNIIPVSQDIEAPTGEVSLLIDAYQKKMTVYEDGEPYHEFPVAVGKPSTKSPVGEWAIIAKDAHWGGGFGVRWMRINVPWGIFGIHGTNKPGSIGTAASHGCIRMFNRDVKKLYSWVEVGTRVKIIGERDPIEVTHDLEPGHTGKDVLLFQESLREHGLEPGYTDARFGSDTEEAVRELKYIYGLQDDLEGDQNTFYILNL
ncbi:L,D-transpeptidase family protein [Fuchsiella alkaliacetigena]|uniref:L,D-transpeptidase family protein n=1 Tax=Fuchsiella alkaliacetigena TaxID=957042 RepID=UPI00200ABAA0|nr:peptidoglycan-binding protein [Fuchsiella alkaliacetigena]MCK8823771.1 peptidoglycan-binding protein [Fuchsiella alkaliacetigena]